MNKFSVTGEAKQFPGPNGWFYVALSDELSNDLRPLFKGVWPALIRADFKTGNTVWQSSIMPIKNGPLFIALPAKVRQAENINAGDSVIIIFTLL